MTKLTAAEFKAFLTVTQCYMTALKEASGKEAMMLAETLYKHAFAFMEYPVSSKLKNRRTLLVAEAFDLIEAKQASRIAILTEIKPEVRKAFGPGDHDPITGMSWERLMSE